MEVVVAMKSKKRNNKIHQQADKSLSSTYRSFRDSDTSLFSLQNSAAAVDGLPAKFHTLHSTTSFSKELKEIHEPSLTSARSLTSLDVAQQCWSSEAAVDPEASPVVSHSHQIRTEPPAGRRLLVYNCLRALGHGQWFNHWRKCQLLIAVLLLDTVPAASFFLYTTFETVTNAPLPVCCSCLWVRTKK